MPFVRFEGKIEPPETPTVTIRPIGNALFNFAALWLVGVKHHDQFVSFYYDAELRKIGFSFSSKKIDSYANKLCDTVSTSGRHTACSRFLHCNDIEHSKPLSYECVHDDANNMIIIDLNKPLEYK